MKKTYLNLKTQYGVETVDEVNAGDFKTYREFRNEVSRLVGEYHMAGMAVYTSSRCVKTWNA